MQIVGYLHSERHGKWRAFDAAHAHADRSACCAFRDARDQMIFGRHHKAAFGSAKLNLRARVVA
jgi:hypothetical protein